MKTSLFVYEGVSQHVIDLTNFWINHLYLPVDNVVVKVVNTDPDVNAEVIVEEAYDRATIFISDDTNDSKSFEGPEETIVHELCHVILDHMEEIVVPLQKGPMRYIYPHWKGANEEACTRLAKSLVNMRYVHIPEGTFPDRVIPAAPSESPLA